MSSDYTLVPTYYGSLVRLYTSDDYRTTGPVIKTVFIYFDCFMRTAGREGDRTRRSLSSKHLPTKGRMDSLVTSGILWKFQCY
jgi:hypothetical protein